MATPILSRVTVTGADDSVSPVDLLKIAEEYPFVEFGILLSPGDPIPRFPSDSWLDELAALVNCAYEENEIALCGHICGPWVKEIFHGKWPWPDMNVNFSSFASRFQLNTHGIWHGFDRDKITSIIKTQSEKGREIIFQYDEQNAHAFDFCMKAGTKVSGLLYIPPVTAQLPSCWTGHLKEVSCGYAGGLSPVNLDHQLARIADMVGTNTIWIDAESSLRSQRDKQFDLGKVRAFLDAARPWVCSLSRTTN